MTTTIWETGDTERIVVTVTEDGTNVDSLAGTIIEFALYNDETVVLSKDTADFAASAPTFTCDLGATDLNGLSSGMYGYEVRVTDGSGNTQSETGTVAIVGITL